MRFVFAIKLGGKQTLRGALVLAKCTEESANPTLRELADKQVIETTGEPVPSSRPWKAA